MAALWTGSLWLSTLAVIAVTDGSSWFTSYWSRYAVLVTFAGQGAFALGLGLVLWHLYRRARARDPFGSALLVIGAIWVLVSGGMAVAAALVEVDSVFLWLQDLSLVGFGALLSLDAFLFPAGLAIFAVGFSLFLWGFSGTASAAPSPVKPLETRPT